jgi:hypothetical protein
VPLAPRPEGGEGWAWEPSCHAGLLTYHDGRKRWYHCTQCKYFNDRLYHSKMHYQRIHVMQVCVCGGGVCACVLLG